MFMASASQSPPASKILFWAGWVVSVLPALMLIMSAAMKLSGSKEVVEGFAKFEWDAGFAQSLGIIELCSVLIYLLPRTAVLGAILLAGYLGGAIATHFRMADYGHITIPAILGVLFWLGLVLRDARLRALLPLRS
jgi:DoxX-like family